MTRTIVNESAHGQLSEVDQQYTGPRFIVLLIATLAVALAVIFISASLYYMDFSWHPFAHDIVKHTVETSTF